jgi:CBS domain-containing protein
MNAVDQHTLTVGQLMTPDPIVVPDGATAETAVRLLEEYGISGLPVVDVDGLLIGVISEADVVRTRASARLWSCWPELRARHVMHAPALTAGPGMPLDEAARLMESANVHRLVVVGDDQAKPIGIFSTSDLVRALAHRPTDG